MNHRAELAFRRVYERLMNLSSGNCDNPREYRKTLIRRLEVLIPLVKTKVRIVDGYVT